jgi:SWI/SNF-related matrix-associated actin-dependent regulator of chromatin subfamily A3
MIRSRRTANARAVCALHATHRWCITGTPIQNRLGDLSSLLKFLKVSPYDEAKTFDAEISQPWKSRMDETALRKLQTLMKMIALRRPRTVISLPHRSEIIESIAFTAEEIQTYEQARLGTIESIDSALSSERTVGSAYINAFQRINDLRYICNHGKPPLRKNHSASKHLVFDAASFRQELDKLLDIPTLVCLSCGTDIQEDDDATQGLEIPQGRPVRDALQLCRHCSTQRPETTVPSPLGSDKDDTITTCDSAPVFSSKVTALVSQLQRVPTGDKWCEYAISSVVRF